MLRLVLVLKLNLVLCDGADVEGVVIEADGVRFESMDVSRDGVLSFLLDFCFIIC